MNIHKLTNINDFEALEPSIVQSLFKLDESFHYDYHEDTFLYNDWLNMIHERLNNNVVYIIASKLNKVCGYSAFVEDRDYNNMYLKNFTIDSTEGFNTVAYRVIVKETFTYFLNSEFEKFRFSTHKSNREINLIGKRLGLSRTVAPFNPDYYLYEADKSRSKNYIFYKIFKKW